MIRLKTGKRGAAIGMLALLLMFALSPAGASAHSALVSAVPGESSDKAVSEIALTFNEAIDKGSKATVTNEAGEEQPLQGIAVKGQKLTATLETPLQSGTYEVSWRVISADGHPLKGSYSLKVDAPEPMPKPEPSASASAEASVPPTASTSSAPPVAASTSGAATDQGAGENDASDDGGSWDSSIVLLVGAAAVLLVAIAGTALKKRKK